MANSSIKNLNIDGNVVISGSTTSIDVQQLTTDDTNITLNDIASPVDANADGGGFTLKGATDKTFNWIDATNSWTSSEHIDLITGKEYYINNTSVLSATTLGSGIVNSSLTDVGTLTSLQVDNIFVNGSQIGLKTTDEDLIILTLNTVTVAGTVAATAVTGDGSGITGLSTSNIVVPASPGDFLYNNAGAWGGITPPISVALGGTGATTVAAARTALGVTATGADTTYPFRANNLDDLANVATARTNLGLGTMAVETATNYLTVANDLSEVGNSTARTNLGLGITNSPKFGGVGTGTITIEATPSSGGTVAPTFSGTSFKSVPVASGSGHKWVVGNEQAGNLTFSYFTINDAGANTSSAVGYITLDPANTRVILGNAGGTAVNVIMSGLSYPSADGTAGYILKTDGAASLSWTSMSAAGALLTANNLSDLANAATSRTNLGVANTDNIAEGTNEYWTTAKFDTRFVSKGINSLADITITSVADDEVLVYDSGTSKWVNETLLTTKVDEGTNLYYTDARVDAYINASILTTDVSEGTNLYYTNARADARIALANLSDLVDVHTAAPTDGDVLAWDNGNSRWAASIHKAVIVANDVNDTHIDWGTGTNQVSTADIPESTKLFYTDARADARIAAADTGDLTEGSNLYFTNARADGRIALANLSDLVDVHTAAPTDGQSLSWDNSNSRWAPGNAGHASTSTLAEGTNLYYTNARADARADVRIAASSVNALSDVTITTPATNAMLQYNGSAWIDAVPTTAHVTEHATKLYYTDARADARIVNAGSANWNTAYTDTNAATDAATNSTIVKRGGTGNIAVSKLTANNGVILGTMPSAATGGIQWTGTDFHGYNGSAWVSLTSAATAQLSGTVATFTTMQSTSSSTYIAVPGYTASITVTDSNIINVQVTCDVGNNDAIGLHYIRLIRTISGSDTPLFTERVKAKLSQDRVGFNISYADTHGQSTGTVITYSLEYKAMTGTVVINPDTENAQIFLYEITTSPTTVASVNGASGTVVLDTDDIAEGTTNKYFTTSGATVNTDNLAEGSTNLYHQDDLGSV